MKKIYFGIAAPTVSVKAIQSYSSKTEHLSALLCYISI